jgi:hypothetical protein
MAVHLRLGGGLGAGIIGQIGLRIEIGGSGRTRRGVCNALDRAGEAERIGRPIPLPLHLKLWLTFVGLLASRRRRERMKRFAAYVLLTPR